MSDVRTIHQYSTNNKLVDEYCTITDASKYSNISETDISSCLDGLIRSINGMQFRYSDYDEIANRDSYVLANVPSDTPIVRQLLSNGMIYKEYPSVLYAGIILRVNPMTILSRINGHDVSSDLVMGYKWELYEIPKDIINRSIVQLKLDGTGISSYNSLGLAAYKSGVDSRSMVMCLQGNCASAGGFIWKLGESIVQPNETVPEIKSREPYKHYTKKPVDRYTLDGKFVASYDSVTSAASAIGTAWQNVSQCCYGKLDSINGAVFRFSVPKKGEKKKMSSNDFETMYTLMEKTNGNIGSLTVVGRDSKCSGKYIVMQGSTHKSLSLDGRELFIAKACGADIEGCAFTEAGLMIECTGEVITREGFDIPEVWRPIGDKVNKDGSIHFEVSNYGNVRWRSSYNSEYVVKNNSYGTGVPAMKHGSHAIETFMVQAFLKGVPENWKFRIVRFDGDLNNKNLWNLSFRAINEPKPKEKVTTKSGRTDVQRVRTPLNQYDMSGKFIKTFDSIREAADSIGKDRTNLRRACSDGIGMCGDYYWGLTSMFPAGVNLDLSKLKQLRHISGLNDPTISQLVKAEEVEMQEQEDVEAQEPEDIKEEAPATIEPLSFVNKCFAVESNSDVSGKPVLVTDIDGKQHSLTLGKLQFVPMSLEDAVLWLISGGTSETCKLTKTGVCLNGVEVPYEIWKSVPARVSSTGIFDPVLLVSSLGRVKVAGGLNENGIWHDSEFIEPKLGNGVPYIKYNGQTFSLDELIAETFIGRKPSVYDFVKHTDGDVTNCCAYNLEWEMKE